MKNLRLAFNHLLMVLTCLFLGYSGASRAATIDELKICKHSYVMVADDYTNNGLGTRTKDGLFGSDYFLDVTGGSVATNKGATDLSIVDSLGINKAPLYVTQEIVKKYGEYGKHLNSLRLKNAQNVIAMRPTAGSKIIFFLQGNNKTGEEARYPKLSKSSDLSNPLNDAPTADFSESTVAGFKYEFTIPNDWGTDDVLYMGSYNGDMFISYIIVEVPEPEGTPTVVVGKQTYENGLWYREVICKASKAYGFETILTYTTDGTAPTASSPVYTAPIKCYEEMIVKFQAFLDPGTGIVEEAGFLQNANNEIAVNFQFDAPTIEVDGPSFAIISPYIDQNGVNYYQVNGMTYEGNEATLTESGTIMAYTEIVNGDYTTFMSMSSVQDVYVLNPIKEKKTIKVITGSVVLDEWERYRIENGAISADKDNFFVKNLEFAAITDPSYQVEDEERYIKMNNTNITFLVADGDSVHVKVVCSKNSCKNLWADDLNMEPVIDRMCCVNVDGINYCRKDAYGNDVADLLLYPDANIIEFDLGSGYHTFQKYSGTGNIYIASIEITPNEEPFVYEIPEPELVWQKLVIVDEITKDVEQKPRSGYDGDKVEVDLAKALPKLGISARATLAQDVLRQMIFAKKVYVTGETAMGVLMSDSLTNESSSNSIGFWLRNVSDAEGNPTFECGRFTYDSDDCFYAEAFEYNAETGILSCFIGQMPNKLKGGNTYFADIYIVYGDKAIKIRYNLILAEDKAGTLEDYEKVGESTIRVEMEPAETYDTKDFCIDIETIINTLGCEVGERYDFYMLDSDVDFAGKNSEGVGYWVAIDGAVINWGDNAMFYVTPKADDFSKFGIGQYPGHMNVGDSVRANLYFLANSKYYQLGIDLVIVEPKQVSAELESIAHYDVEVQQVPVAYTLTTGVEIPEAWVEEQIGTSDWVLYALAPLNSDGSEKEGNARYSKQYTFTPYPGFWMDGEGHNIGWNSNARVGATIASPEGSFALMQYPDVALGDVFRFPLFLVNEETGKMVTFNFTYSIVESVVEIKEVGSEDIVLPVSAEGATTTIDLAKAAEALGTTVDALVEGKLLHGMTADSTYGGGVSIYDGLSFDVKGNSVMSEADTYMFFAIEPNDDGATGTLTTYGTEAIADDFSAVGVMCFLVDGNRYVYNVKFVSEEFYTSGKQGDVNHDKAIDVTDVVLIIDNILENNPANFDASLADVNNDGEIDVTDVVTVIDIILGKVALSRGAEQIDRSAYTAFQMNLTIPVGYVLESVSLTDIAKDSHTLAYNMLADGRCRVVVCSMNNEALPGAWDEVIRLNLRGQGDAQMTIDRAVFVTIDGERHELLMNPTSIAQISNLKSQTSNQYDLQGRKVEKTAKGIFVVDGKKTVRK